MPTWDVLVPPRGHPDPVAGRDGREPLFIRSEESPVSDDSCLFCRIVDGEVPADVVHETDRVLAFRDIDPKAPTHVLVIPRKHLTSLGAAGDDDGSLLGEIMLAARDVARGEGIADSGFRAVTNSGDEGGQEVQHLHVHVLGGRQLGWPPG